MERCRRAASLAIACSVIVGRYRCLRLLLLLLGRERCLQPLLLLLIRCWSTTAAALLLLVAASESFTQLRDFESDLIQFVLGYNNYYRRRGMSRTYPAQQGRFLPPPSLKDALFYALHLHSVQLVVLVPLAAVLVEA